MVQCKSLIDVKSFFLFFSRALLTSVPELPANVPFIHTHSFFPLNLPNTLPMVFLILSIGWVKPRCSHGVALSVTENLRSSRCPPLAPSIKSMATRLPLALSTRSSYSSLAGKWGILVDLSGVIFASGSAQALPSSQARIRCSSDCIRLRSTFLCQITL